MAGEASALLAAGPALARRFSLFRRHAPLLGPASRVRTRGRTHHPASPRAFHFQPHPGAGRPGQREAQAGSHGPRHVKAVRVEDAPVCAPQQQPAECGGGSLELGLQQRRLQQLWDTPAAAPSQPPETALRQADAALAELKLIRQKLESLGAGGGQMAAAPPAAKAANAIVPAPAGAVRIGGRGLVTPVTPSPAKPAQRPQQEEQQQQQQQCEDEQPAAVSEPEPSAAAAVVAKPAKRRGRPAKGTRAASPARGAASPEEAGARPPRRRRRKAGAAAAAAANTAALDEVLAAVAQLAADTAEVEAPAAAGVTQPADRTATRRALDTSTASSSCSAAPSPPAARAAQPGQEPLPAARSLELVCSTRSAKGSRQLGAAKPMRRRRARLAAPPAALALQAGAAQLVVGRTRGQPATEGERDAAYLAKMVEALQRGRSRKRASSRVPAGIVGMFMARLGDTPVLNKEQEMRLAHVLQRGRRVQAAADDLAQRLQRKATPAEVAAELGLSEEEAALRLVNEGTAKDLLFQYNLRLVVHIAKRYSNLGMDLSDLIQEGELGLRKSIERFDPDRGFRFSTFAHWYIRQPISRAVAEQGRDVRLPVHVCEVITRIHRAEAELNKDPTRSEPASREEVARALGMPLPRLLHFLRLAKSPRTVETGAGEGGSSYMTASMKEVSLEEQWEDEEFTEQVEAVNHFEYMKQNVSFILSTLPKRERNILRMRYGLLQRQEEEADAVVAHLLGGAGLNPYGYGGSDAQRAGGAGAAAAAAAAAAAGPAGAPSAAAAAAAASRLRDSGQAPPGPMELSLTEVSFAYNLSKERIRQLEDRALRALRNPWRVRLLHEINNGNRLSAGTLAHLQAAARGPRQRAGSGPPAGGSGSFSN